MPLYDYACRRCGPFRKWRGMSAYDKPAKCPNCGKAARRSVTAPMLGMRDAALRKAHEINERSAHEPRLVHRKRGDPIPSHDAHRDLTEARQRQNVPRRGRGDKDKLNRSSHPWAVRH